MLVLLNVPLIGIWVKLLTIPYKYLYPSALFFVCIGVYAANNDMMERCQRVGSWDGYPGGDAPGFSFETLDFVKDTQLAALASDTWGCEVRPNESEEGINQPWHWITIPIMIIRVWLLSLTKTLLPAYWLV